MSWIHTLSVSALAFTALAPMPARAQMPFGPNTVADVAEKVTPAVVSIRVERTRRATRAPSGHPLPDFFFGPKRGPQRERGAGSGVVISADGHIVTNNHVIDGADSIDVIFADGREFEAKLIGTDKSSDLALVKIDARGVPHLAFGDSSKLRLGEFVLAIGNPFGVGQTVTMGIVSATGRANIGIVDYENFIQTDAAINPGNSGGALVSLRGELVGINTAILSRTQHSAGIGFAIPSSMAKPILQQVRDHGRVRRGWLGVAIQDLSPDLAETFGLEGVEGVLLSDVMQGGPAARGGLRSGDVIMKVNDKPTRSSAELRNTIALLGPGTKARLSVHRDGKTRNMVIKLAEKKSKEKTPEASASSEEGLLSGLELKKLDEELKARIEAPSKLSGIIITDVERQSAAADSGLRPGDVVTAANRRRVRSVKDLRKAARGASKLLLRVWRRGSFVFVVLHR